MRKKKKSNNILGITIINQIWAEIPEKMKVMLNLPLHYNQSSLNENCRSDTEIKKLRLIF
jgi:hypothetical protein